MRPVKRTRMNAGEPVYPEESARQWTGNAVVPRRRSQITRVAENWGSELFTKLAVVSPSG